MKRSIYIYNEGQLQRKDNTLRYTRLDGTYTDLPIETISDVYLMTEMTLSTSMLNLASRYGICVHFFNYYDYYTGSFVPKETLVSGRLLVKQTQAYLDREHRLRLAKQFVLGAGKNIYRTLRYYNNRGKNLKETMNELEIPDQTEEIGEEAFCGCKMLEKVVLPNSVNRIKKGCFKGSLNLNEVVLPSSLSTEILYSKYSFNSSS